MIASNLIKNKLFLELKLWVHKCVSFIFFLFS